jgi:hypothetical protein
MMMRWTPVCLALLMSCTANDPSGVEPRGGEERWATEQIRTASIDQAILRQRTVFSYHFHPGSGRLNELGRRDLAVLSRRYVLEAGELSVRRGDATEELHRARVEAVLSFLAELGIDPARASVIDAPPDGEGIASVRLVQALSSPGLAGEREATTGGSSR